VELDQRVSLELAIAKTSADWELAHQFLNEEHYLGAGRESGDRLCQFVVEDGQVVAVMIWCAAAWHLKDRDDLIGWDPVMRSRRLKLVVQLRRFLVLDEHRRPNLASQCLGLGLRKVQSQWFNEHGYEPLLAESFSDPESHAGTLYKVTNWVQAGKSKGFSQKRSKQGSDHTNYYEANDRPKKLWLYPLHKNAYSLMCGRELPEKSQKADIGPGGERSPLKADYLKSLRDAFKQLHDPRSKKSRRYPLPAMLSLISLGLLMGGRDMKNIWTKVTPLSQAHRLAIGLVFRDKKSNRIKMPGYDALNNILAVIDPAEYAKVLTRWLQDNAGNIPNSLALDGKHIGDGSCGMIITLCQQSDGRPVAMIPATGVKEDCEVSEARKLLNDSAVQIAGSIITADALHNKKETLHTMVKRGADYLIDTKENTPKRREVAQKALENTPFLPRTKIPVTAV